MTLTISNLPRDLIEVILCRVPLSSMRAVRFTCKQWETLSNSGTFRKQHIGQLGEASREREPQVVVAMDHSLHLMSVVGDEDKLYTKSIGKLTCLEEQVKISRVYHCEGLLLCILKDDSRFVVWNPYCGQIRWIKRTFPFPYPPPKGSGDEVFSYALGYVNKRSGRSHKLLMFIQNFRYSAYEIYDFDSDSWTRLDLHPYWFIRCATLGVTLKGNTYWGAARVTSFYCYVDRIIGFDFTTERFGPLLPLPFRIKGMNATNVAMACVKEEKLAALFCQVEPEGPPQSLEIEIWITTSEIEFGKNMSWSKLFTVALSEVTNSPFVFTEGSFFFDEVKKVSMLFLRDKVVMIGYDGIKVVGLGKHAHANALPIVCPYAPSVVQIKQPTRKDESSRY